MHDEHNPMTCAMCQARLSRYQLSLRKRKSPWPAVIALLTMLTLFLYAHFGN